MSSFWDIPAGGVSLAHSFFASFVIVACVFGIYRLWHRRHLKAELEQDHALGIIMDKKMEHDRLETQRRKREEAQDRLCRVLERTFGVDPDTVGDGGVQDEIVRIVNHLGHQTAAACVNQDKAGRGEETGDQPSRDVRHWNEEVLRLKREWALSRKAALMAVPSLSDRMPHFSQMEPLRTYNAEYLLKKRGSK